MEQMVGIYNVRAHVSQEFGYGFGRIAIRLS
jgi:hypothetical protein